jgi:prepilin-type N-terminal cleavage/methylation domain-containing protein
MRNGFTLVEILVVIGIIVILTGASIGGFSSVTKAAEKTKARELVSDAATALSSIYQKTGYWPRKIAAAGENDGKLDKDVAPALEGYLSMNISNGKLIGLDRFGIVSPWATAVLKRSGASAGESTVVSTAKDGTHSVDDHILHFAVDVDGDGITEATVGGDSVNIRAVAVVWCAGRDGKMEPYSARNKSDDVYSWAPGQANAVAK